MGHLEHLSPGKGINFQFNMDGEELTYEGRVHDINDRSFSIEINDEDLRERPIFKGMKARLFGQHQKDKISLPVRIECAETLPLLHIRQNNSRSHIRADGFIRLKYVRILEEEYGRIRDQYLNEISPDSAAELSDSDLYFMLENDPDTNAIPKKFLNEIHFLNKKLYFFQKFMSNSEEADLFEKKPTKVNISGSGLKFISGECFHVGDLFDIKMILPTSPFSVVKAVGLVLRVDKLPSQKSHSKESLKKIAVRFVAINEDHVEAIIRCVFTWQRKALRENKTR